MPRVPVLHMGSFSRSGETLVMRTLAAHPRIEIVFQLFEPDDPRDVELFRFLRRRKRTWIDSDHRLLAHREIPEGAVLLLKNAVWTHPHPFEGFILVRNPFSVMNSARLDREKPQGEVRRREQVVRWAKGIDPSLLPIVAKEDNLTAFCRLYERKMTLLHETGLPILHYERFVASPEKSLKALLPALGLEWHEPVLRAHEQYEEGMLGHGKIKLWRPIHPNSLDKYQEFDPDAFAKVRAMCARSLELYGYEVVDGQVRIREDVDVRM